MAAVSPTSRFAKLALIAAATLATAAAVPACSKPAEVAPPTATSAVGVAAPTATTTVEVPGPSTPQTAEQAADCGTNADTAPVPTAEPYATVPEADQVSVAVVGIASGEVTLSQPSEIDVTVCNDSPVSYPQVGLVVALEHCSCATNPLQIPSGTVEYLDADTGNWVALPHPVEGGGMDHLNQFTNVQELPKGRAVTVRYRITLDASMTDGDGGVAATVVTADGSLNQIGTARLPFAVLAG